MKTLLCAVLFVCACIVPACATTYYLSPTGNDGNSGVNAASAWLTPSHALNCGDVVVAAASTAYVHTNFRLGKWGPVTCASGNNVAWLKCAVFDACKITVPDGTHDYGMAISASYWGVQGWEVSNLESDPNGLSCFTAQPADNSASIHHIIFANDIANTCALAGFGGGNTPNATSSIDYLVVVGSIAYNTGTSNAGCGSGIDILTPAASDNLPGTHIYVAGNFSFANIGPQSCWDANGISFDSFDGRYYMPSTYSQQAVIENNISVGNQGVGVRVQYNEAGNGTNFAHIYVLQNTMWGNSNSWNQFGSPDCGEYQQFRTENTTVMFNLAVTNQQGCYNASWNPLAAYTVKAPSASDVVMQNWGYSANGYNSLAISSTGATSLVPFSPIFTFGPRNTFGVDPQYASPHVPGAPNCSSSASVPDCMAGMIAGFTPKLAAASTYGYQAVSSVIVPDPYFPKWLCSANDAVPSSSSTMLGGLINLSCP